MGRFYDFMDREIRIRGLAENTRKIYLENMRRFVRHVMRPPDERTAEDVKQYQLLLTKDKRLAWSTFNVYVCAIRFFYQEVLRVNWEVKHIPYQKTGKSLPVILSGEEVVPLLEATTNLKHRAILMTLYSGGLRSGEALHRRAADIDSKRMVIRIDQGKGHKDRHVMLSEKLLDTLRRYWREDRPAAWLFPGQDPTSSLTRGSVGRLFALAKERAGIKKRVFPHSLRHSFATHLLERGANIRVIQRLLGHRSLRSTEIYAHMAESYVRDTKSPLDDLLPAVLGRELPAESPVPAGVAQHGHPELADIFRTHGQRLAGLSGEQRKVVAAIVNCRTAALGGHVRKCDRGCGYQEISYNSCRDRHCPKCPGLERVRWQEARAEDLLPVPYFHLVFTIPDALHELFLSHPRVAYGLLFAAVGESVQEVAANPKNLGAEIGMTAVPHTWTQTLLYHPHVRCIVPGGRLDSTRHRWIPARQNFFLSVRILSTVFRAKLLAGFERAVASGKIESSVASGPEVSTLLRRAARRKWVVFSKRPFAGPQQVLAYLGRYTHRMAISNGRIVSMDGDEVTFLYKDRADGNRQKPMALPAEAFLRRFRLHVLPRGFVRIRHYGILANSIRRDRIALCRRLLEMPAEAGAPPCRESWEQMLLRLTGKDVTRCPQCGAGQLSTTREIKPSTRTWVASRNRTKTPGHADPARPVASASRPPQPQRPTAHGQSP